MGLFRRTKSTNQPLLKQVLDLIPNWILRNSTSQYKSDKGCSRYKTYDQLVSLSFGQLNKCDSLSEISSGIGVSKTFISDLGLRQSPARSTMSDGNRQRDYRVFEHLYSSLLSHYSSVLKKHSKSSVITEIKDQSVKLIDSTSISLCLSMFDWAKFRTAKGGIKIHTCLNAEISLPDLVNITEAKVNDRHGLTQLIFPKNTIIVEDRAYFDFSLMYQRIQAKNVFITRIKQNTSYQSISEKDLPELEDQDILKDEIITLTGQKAVESQMDQQQLRLVSVYKEDQNKVIQIITNNMEWSARTISDLYKKRWDIELFFKALKQNLKVNTFWGTSENAVKSQIYVALICFLLTQLIGKIISKKKQAFSSLIAKIRNCLAFYLPLEYVVNNLSDGAKKVNTQIKIRAENRQTNIFPESHAKTQHI